MPCRKRLAILICLWGGKRSLIFFWGIGIGTWKVILPRTRRSYPDERRGKRLFFSVYLMCCGVLAGWRRKRGPKLFRFIFPFRTLRSLLGSFQQIFSRLL